MALDEDLGDVAVTVSELVTNAIRHGTPPIEVGITIEDGRVRVEVTDHGGGEPQPKNPEVTAPDGRGLALIDVLADEWGASIEGGRTTVWAAFAVDHVLDGPA